MTVRPRRIQRRRVRGWHRPRGATIVDRTSRYGNPFTIGAARTAGFPDPRQTVVDQHRRWLDGDPAYPDTYQVGRRTFDRRWVNAHLHELADRDLCCPCPPGAVCHADTLLERANRRNNHHDQAG
ncbi:DUF4326 domain-containing protein [Amycolatopsis sp. NPDC058986]|uniref:DUF4326 domain-containing protein n=1 Tax=unclassified Amycolatopsis TaxID=2618356 RepID=UPI003672B116